MPKRSTDRQRVIYYIRDHLKPEGWEVTEGKQYADRITGVLREVDVVVEGDMPTGEHIVIGIEVADRSRKADAPYMEQLIEKHRSIPTDKVIVVSWKGFYEPALLKAAANDIIAITPEAIDGTVNESLHFAMFRATPKRVRLVVTDPSGAHAEHQNVPLNIWVYRRSTGERMELHQLAAAVLMAPVAGDAIARQIINAPEDMADPWIDYEASLNGGDYFVHDDASDTDHVIDLIEIAAAMEYQRTSLDFELQRLGSTLFGLTKVEMLGIPIQIVLTEGVEPNTAKVSYFASIDQPKKDVV